MTEPSFTRHERIVVGSLLLGCAMLGTALMAQFPMDVAGRDVAADVPFGIAALALAALALAAAVWLSVRFLGSKEGLGLIRREVFASLWGGAIAGMFAGFFIRAIFPGPTAWAGLIVAFGATAYFISWFAKKAA